MEEPFHNQLRRADRTKLWPQGHRPNSFRFQFRFHARQSQSCQSLQDTRHHWKRHFRRSRFRIIITDSDYDHAEDYRERLFDRFKSEMAGSHVIIIGHSLCHGSAARTHTPPIAHHHPAREQVIYGRHIEPALGGPDVGEVGDPLLIRSFRFELPVQNVQWHGRDLAIAFVLRQTPPARLRRWIRCKPQSAPSASKSRQTRRASQVRSLASKLASRQAPHAP
jgi:hypothetical protein